MTTIVVLFNLKPDVSVEEYEAWARATDLPIVGGLDSVRDFRVLRSNAQLGSDTPPSFQYIEVLDLVGLPELGQDLATATMQRVAAEFQRYADSPQFIVTESL